MALTTLVPQIVNVSKTKLELANYPRLVLPAGMLTVWEPKIIAHEDLQKRAGHVQKGAIGSVNGLTEAGFSILFDSPTQWTKDNAGLWQFQGGNVYLRVDLMIYVTDRFEGKNYRDDAFQLIMCHELKHWKDATDIVSNWLPPKVTNQPDLKRMLFDDGTGQRAKLSQKEYDEWITIVNPDTGGYKYEDVVGDLYITEHDRRHRLADSDAEYETYSGNINCLRQNMAGSVRWPK